MKTRRTSQKSASRTSPERILPGLGVAPGVAVGPAHVVESGSVPVPDYPIASRQVAAEQERFAAAVAKSRRQVVRLRRKAAALPGSASEQIADLLDAYLHMLSDSRLIRGVDKRIRAERINAEAAVAAEVGGLMREFASLEDAYLAARGQEIREIGNRLQRNLTETPHQAFERVPRGAIVIAEELTPADTALLDPSQVAGIATELGGAEGHTAIMARALGLPAVLGAADLMASVRSGATIVVDGDLGRVVVKPPARMVSVYKHRRAARLEEARRLNRLRRLPAVTRDGCTMSLQANIELPLELEAAIRSGAEGIGLLRTEFMFMNRDTLPDEDEQYRVFRAMVAGMDGRPVTIRTLDIGGEKLTSSLTNRHGDPANPALGLRAIRLSLKFPELLDTQLAAILRAGAHGPVRILLPMITTQQEVRQVRERLKRVVRRLKRRRVRFDDKPSVGAMIEVPGAALAADSLAQVVDFFAIGTNDLTMYTLATDRADEQVAHIYNPLHPSVLKLIQLAIQSALKARIPVSVCGEMAGDPLCTPLLTGLGLRELSMSATNLPRVKKRLRGLDLTEATRRAEVIMLQADAGRVAAMLDDFNAFA
ncbi:MAG: phosphoenolpyruvate--protein phosphotransferase [Alphaproteobacteria bacterium]